MASREVEPRFKGQKFRKRRRWSRGEWRNKVLRRDNSTCRMCGYRGPHLSAHHVIFLSHCEEKYETDRRNGLTLCNWMANGCHEALHAGKRKIRPSMLPQEVLDCVAEQGLRYDPETGWSGTLSRYFEQGR